MAAFVTFEEYEVWAQTTLTPTQAAAVQATLDAACSAILRITGNIELVTDDDIVLDGTGSPALLLPNCGVDSPERVLTVNSVTVGDDDPLTTDDWHLNFAGILYRKPSLVNGYGWTRVWPFGYGNIAVNYDHGYSPIPQPIKEVAFGAAKNAYHGALQTPGIKSETIGGYSYTRDSAGNVTSIDLSQGLQNILSQWAVRRVPVP